MCECPIDTCWLYRIVGPSCSLINGCWLKFNSLSDIYYPHTYLNESVNLSSRVPSSHLWLPVSSQGKKFIFSLVNTIKFWQCSESLTDMKTWLNSSYHLQCIGIEFLDGTYVAQVCFDLERGVFLWKQAGVMFQVLAFDSWRQTSQNSTCLLPTFRI